MSETVYYKGIATKIEPEGKTLIEIAEEILKEKGIDFDDFFKDTLEQLSCDFYDEYFYHKKTKTLYKITKESFNLEEEIIRADKKDDGTIEYELRYYNGGGGFEECLEEAFDKL